MFAVTIMCEQCLVTSRCSINLNSHKDQSNVSGAKRWVAVWVAVRNSKYRVRQEAVKAKAEPPALLISFLI